MDDRGVYLYGFTRPGALSDDPVLGLDGQSVVVLLEWEGLAAAYCLVSLSEFQGEQAETNLRNLDWVISHACHHEQVVERLMARAAVLPVALRFGLFLRRGPVPHAGSSAKGHLPIPGPYRGQGGVGRQSLPRYPVGHDTTHPGRSVAGRAEPPVTGFSRGALPDGEATASAGPGSAPSLEASLDATCRASADGACPGDLPPPLEARHHGEPGRMSLC